MNYATAAGIENKDHWIEPHLPDLDRDIKEEVEIDFVWSITMSSYVIVYHNESYFLFTMKMFACNHEKIILGINTGREKGMVVFEGGGGGFGGVCQIYILQLQQYKINLT